MGGRDPVFYVSVGYGCPSLYLTQTCGRKAHSDSVYGLSARVTMWKGT